MRLPAEPLLRLVDVSAPYVSRSDESALLHARRSGWVSEWTADRLAVKVLRVHPMTVWGDAWLV